MDPKQTAIKAGVTAGIAGFGSLLLGQYGNIEFFKMSFPGFMVSAGTAGLSSIAADLGHVYIIPHIPVDKKFENTEAMALNGGLGAASFAAFSFAGIEGLEYRNAGKLALFGAGSVLGGEYLYNQWFNKNAVGKMF
jgi:hypothetical protein